MKFHLDYIPSNWNEYINIERSNKYYANNVKQKDKKVMIPYAHMYKYTGNYPIELIFYPHYKNKRSDIDNFRVKGIIDGMVGAKIIENDNLNKIVKYSVEAVFDDTYGVDIEIKEYTKNEQ